MIYGGFNYVGGRHTLSFEGRTTLFLLSLKDAVMKKKPDKSLKISLSADLLALSLLPSRGERKK